MGFLKKSLFFRKLSRLISTYNFEIFVIFWPFFRPNFSPFDHLFFWVNLAFQKIFQKNRPKNMPFFLQFFPPNFIQMSIDFSIFLGFFPGNFWDPSMLTLMKIFWVWRFHFFLWPFFGHFFVVKSCSILVFLFLCVAVGSGLFHFFKKFLTKLFSKSQFLFWKFLWFLKKMKNPWMQNFEK